MKTPQTNCELIKSYLNSDILKFKKLIKNGENILHRFTSRYEYKESIHYKYFEKISKLHPKLLSMKNCRDYTPLDILRIKNKNQ